MSEGIKGAIIGALGALAAVLAAVATGWFGYASKDDELRVHLVEIAIGILRADPKEDVTPARAWAIDVIEKNSGVKFLPEDRAALLHKPILSKDINWKAGWIFDNGSGGIMEDIMKKADPQAGGAKEIPPAAQGH